MNGFRTIRNDFVSASDQNIAKFTPLTIWHRFSVQLLMLFQMVCSALLTAVLHPKTVLLIGCEISTANQIPTNKWFLMATQKANQSTPSEIALKTELKTGVRLFVAFCLT